LSTVGSKKKTSFFRELVEKQNGGKRFLKPDLIVSIRVGFPTVAQN